jgi:hypothetical protein
MRTEQPEFELYKLQLFGTVTNSHGKTWSATFLSISITLPSVILPLFQNVRRLSFSQKSTYFKFDQIYT